MCLLVRQRKVDEVSHEAAQLIEDQVGMGLQLELVLVFFGLDEALQALEALLEEV